MKFTTLKSLKINGEYYTHVINPKTDATYLLDESGEKFYEVDSDGYMWGGSQLSIGIGVFRKDSTGSWTFKWTWGKEEVSYCSPDLIYTEQQVFKELLTQQ